MHSFLDRLILFSFFLSKELEFLYFLTDVVLVSYKPVSYKKTCINSYKIRADKRLWNLDISRLKRAVFSIFSYGVTAQQFGLFKVHKQPAAWAKKLKITPKIDAI